MDWRSKTIIKSLQSLAALPEPVQKVLCTCLGAFTSYLPLKENKIARLQMKRFLKEKAPSLSKTYAHFFRLLFEVPILEQLIHTNRVKCTNMADVQTWHESGRPLIALTAHLGNWDLLAAWFIKQGLPITTIGRQARAGILQAALSEIRSNYGIKTIWRNSEKNESSTLKELLGDLKANKVVSALIDQDTRVDSTFIPFFGVPVKTPHALVNIALKRKAIVVSAFIVRETSEDYEILVEELPTDQGVVQVLTEFNLRLECIIKKHPEQWVWFHKRWRTLENGETLSSARYLEYLRSQLNQDTY